MQIMVNRRNLILLIISLCCMCGMLALLPYSTAFSDEWCTTISIYLLALFVIQFFLLKMSMPRKRMLLYLHFTLCYIFHFSQVIIRGIGFEMDESVKSSSIFRYYGNEIPIAAEIAVKAIIGLFLGYMIYQVFRKNNRNAPRDLDMPVSKNLCTILALVGACCDIVSNIIYFSVMLKGGYTDVSLVRIPYFVRIGSYLLLPGVLLSLSRADLSPEKKKSLTVIFIIYKIICMTTGFRAYSLINIILIAYFYYRRIYGKKLSLKTIILLLISLQVGGGILVGIRNTRSTGIDLKVILEYILSPGSNLLINMCSEFGITLNVICAAVRAGSMDGTGGTQLLQSILSIIPGISSIFPNVDFASMVMVTALDIHSVGGSYIGDLFFDFGQHYLIFAAMVLGILFAKIYENFEYNIQNGLSIKVAFVAPIIVEFMYSVRSSLAKMPRMIVWYAALFMVIKVMSSRKR